MAFIFDRIAMMSRTLSAAALAAAVLLTSPLGEAQTATQSADLIHTFSQCDRAFFDALTAAQTTWSPRIALSQNNGVAYPTVDNRLTEGKRIQRFAQPIDVDGVELVGYFDSAYVAGPLLRAYDWGFLIKGPTSEAATKLRPLIADTAHFQAEPQGSWARGEHRAVAQGETNWQAGATALGVAPAAGTAERDLFMTDGDYAPAGESELTCSVQGFVTQEVIAPLRPDLDAPALALALPNAAAGITEAKTYTSDDHRFKITLPPGWSPFHTPFAHHSQLTFEKSMIGPVVAVRSYDSGDIVDPRAFLMGVLATTPIGRPNAGSIKVTQVTLDDAPAVRADYQTMAGNLTMQMSMTIWRHDRTTLLVTTGFVPGNGSEDEFQPIVHSIRF
jgi:hypothetical protein